MGSEATIVYLNWTAPSTLKNSTLKAHAEITSTIVNEQNTTGIALLPVWTYKRGQLYLAEAAAVQAALEVSTKLRVYLVSVQTITNTSRAQWCRVFALQALAKAGLNVDRTFTLQFASRLDNRDKRPLNYPGRILTPSLQKEPDIFQKCKLMVEGALRYAISFCKHKCMPLKIYPKMRFLAQSTIRTVM